MRVMTISSKICMCSVIIFTLNRCFAGNLFAVTSERGNLFQNAGFEKSADNDLSNWHEVTHGSTGGTLTVINDNLVAYSGNKCVKLKVLPKGLIGVMQGSRIFPAKRYIASVFAKGSGKMVMHLHLYKWAEYRIRALEVPKEYKKTFVFDVSENWKQYTVEFTGPEGVHSVNLSIYTRSKETLYIDNASLMYFHPAAVRFLPSFERLVVNIDAGFVKTDQPTEAKLPEIKAEVTVYSREEENSKPVISHTVSDFSDFRATWRCSTEKLPEGDYTVNIRVKNSGGEILAEDDDWFKKKIFEWMKNKPWQAEEVPAPYTPLKIEGNRISPWGRQYTFEKSGLLKSVVSQNRELLAKPLSFYAEINNSPVDVICRDSFSVVNQKPGIISARSELAAGGLGMSLDIITEYDGFVLYRLYYRPLKDSVKINRLRLKIPLNEEHAFLYSVGTDRHGTHILGDVFPDKQGKLYDSLNDSRCAYCSPNFCTLFWVGGYYTCFCYAADSDKGWILRDNAPAVEVYREDEEIILWLNLVDEEYVLKDERVLEFAFQAGPVKPLPKGWRGFQDGGNSEDAPLTISQALHSGGGVSAGGGANFIYPGATDKIRKKMQRLRQEELSGGNRAIVGYHFYGKVPKGLEEAKVFRSEWGIDKDTWDSITDFQAGGAKWMWKQQFFGDEKERYLTMGVIPVPSYIDFVSYGYNEVLKYLPFSGFYDDVGFPKQVYDEELGFGGKDIYDRKIYSSGLWIYRTRWKQAAYVNYLNNKPNFLRDSQHVKAHFMPAYGFIGIWAPCEHGYYNRYEDKDILEFYGSLTRYLAHNPAYQFGQIPMIGLSTKKWNEVGTDRDTRCIMMVTMLHDHDVGSFGKRNLRTVCKLRHARNVFRQWEEDVEFIGYWENSEFIKTKSEDVKVSMYTQPGSTLFIIGNTGEKDLTAVLDPDWTKLKIDAKGIRLVNTENMSELRVSKNGFSIPVPRHDIRLVLAGDLGQYNTEPLRLGENLPEPEEKITASRDKFEGPELSSEWEVNTHEGHSSIGFVDNRLYIQGHHYGYSYIKRKLNQDMKDISVQCLIMRRPTGRSDISGGSLVLYWDNGEFLQVVPGRKNFIYSASGRNYTGSPTSKASVPGWYPHTANWVKIRLTPEHIEFCGSADGEKWIMDKQLKREPRYQGAPGYIILGNGKKGENPYFSNVLSKHFNPKNPSVTYFSDLIVGTDSL